METISLRIAHNYYSRHGDNISRNVFTMMDCQKYKFWKAPYFLVLLIVSHYLLW